MKTKLTRSKRQSVTTAGDRSTDGLPLAACQPVAPGDTIEATIAHAKRLAAAALAAVAAQVSKPGKNYLEIQLAGAEEHVGLLEAWPNMSASELVGTLTAANTVPDILFHDAQKGDQAAAIRLISLARQIAILTARLAEAGNQTAVGGLVDLAESATRSLNRIAGENPAAVGGHDCKKLSGGGNQ